MKNKLELGLERIGTYEIMGHQMNVYGDVNEKYLKAMDMAEWLDIYQGKTGVPNISGMVKTIDPSNKLKAKAIGERCPVQQWFITEIGFLKYVMECRKPKAIEYKDLIFRHLLYDLPETELYTDLKYISCLTVA